MKLRIRGNSIRIRISQSELSAIAAGDSVEDSIQFAPGNRLRYGLAVAQSGAARVSFENDRILVQLPQGSVAQWLGPDEVGIEASQAIGGGEQLTILVEKDFTCLAPRDGEEDADTFPNPKAS